MANRQIGFVGLGAMGGGMVTSLLRNGFPVKVYDLYPQARAKYVAMGATEALSPREAAEGVAVVCSSLPMPADVESAALGPNGIIEGIKAGAVYIDLSSIDPGTTKKVGEALAAKGAKMIDSPVGPGPDAAAAGQLTLMLGGDPAVIETCQDVLKSLGARQFYCGPLGSGVATKMINNLVSTTINALNAEAMVLGQKMGLDLDVLTSVMGTTAADSRHLHMTTRELQLNRNFKPRFRLALAHKDIGIAVKYAMQVGVPLPIGNASHLIHSVAMGQGLANEDQAAVIKAIEQVAGVEARYKEGGEK
ncbi:MAG: NAD(P)-dependent oxidoreductase [Chloroflexi bacterium]|nr:NAD(P)-dependent oxidoreductase [Chloroflexota bacterium]